MADTIKGITIQFKGDTIDLDSSISKLNKTMSALKSEASNLNKQLKLDPSSVEKLNSVIKNLQNQQKVLTQELNTYNQELKELDQGSNEWLTMSKRIDGVEKALTTVNQKLKEIQNYQLDRLNKQFKELGESLSKIGSYATAVGQALAPISTLAGASLGYAVKSAIDFEDAFAGVEKTVDGTSAQLAELEQQLRQLATQSPVTAEEFAQIAENAGQLGIAVDDIAEFSEVMAGLGVATNLTSDEASTMIAQFANVVDISGEYERFASALVKLGNDGASTEKEIMELAQRLSGAGAVADMSAQEILGLAASMANVGINAEAGGTAMSTLISQFEKASVQGGESLTALANVSKMSAEDFAEAWSTEPSKAIDAFLAGLNEIQQSGGDVYGTLENLGITEKRLTDTILRLSSASGEVAKNTEMANEAWEENLALQAEVDRAYGTTASKLQTLWNSVKELAMQIGERLLPSINNIIDKIQEFVDGLLGFDNGLQEAEKGVGGVVKALVPFEEAISGLSDETKDLIIKVAGLVAGLAPALLTFGKLSSSVGDLMKEMADNGAFKALVSGFDSLKGTAGKIGKAFGDVGKNLNKMFDFSGAFKDVISMLSGTFGQIGTWVMQGLTKISAPITTFLTSIWTNISGFFTNVLNLIMQNPIVQAITAKISALTSCFQPLITAISSLSIPFTAILAIIALAVVASEDLRNGLLNLGSSILEGLKPVLDTLIQVFTSIWETLTTYLWPVIQQLGDFLAQYIVPILQTLWDWFAQYIIPIINSLVSLLGGAFNTALQVIASSFSTVIDLLTIVFGWLEDIWNWLDDLGVWDAFGAVLEKITEFINGVINALKGMFEWVGKVWDKVTGFISDVGSFFGGIWDSATGWIGDIFGSGGYGYQSGGYASGAINLTTNITVNTSREITYQDTRKWALQMADVINEELGRRL